MELLLKRIESVPGKCILDKELSSSLISQVYLCRFNDTKAVIRFDSPLASKLAIDRENEANLLKNITHLDLSPGLLYSNQSSGIMIWKYISGNKPTFDQNTSNTFSLIELGRSLYSIHSSPIPQNCKNIFFDSMVLYKELLSDASNNLLIKEASDLYDDLVDDGVKKILSHNDLHSKNIIWNSKYYFLDWEYAGKNHPCFDIASLMKSFNLDADQIHDLSIGYGHNLEIFDINILQKWSKFIGLLEQVWETSLTKIVKNL